MTFRRRKRDLFPTHHGDTRKRGWDQVSKKKRGACIPCFTACCCLLFGSVALADDSLWNKGMVAGTDMRFPADFNVFSFNNIEGYTDWNTFHDIEGPVAADASLILKGFLLNYDHFTDHPIAAVVGGGITFDWGGTVFGDVYYGDSYDAPSNQITYAPESTAGPQRGRPIDFRQARADLNHYSELLSNLDPTSGAERDAYGSVHFDCSGDESLKIFEIDSEDLDDPTEIWFDNMEADPIILINVNGSGNDYGSVGISSSNFRSSGSSNINPYRILWNFPNVHKIHIIATGFKGSLLAPKADVRVQWNSFEGTLVAENVRGSAELYHAPFQGYDELQEVIPSTVVHVDDYHLASDIDPNAPGTVGIVTWFVDAGVAVDSAVIKFGLTPGFGMEAPVDLTEPDYRTLLLGMKPDSVYYFQVIVTSGEQTYTSDINSIETGPAPNLMTVYLENSNREARDPGFLISSTWDQEYSTAFILDEDGDIVWWFMSDVGAISRATMSYDGKSMWLMPDAGPTAPCPLQVVSMDTLETEIFDGVGASHDITAVDENTIAYIDYGEADCNSVFTMDKEGNPTEIFETQELEETYDLPPEVVYEPPVCHLNAIHYYPDMGLYSVSDRQLNIIVFRPSDDPESPSAEIVMRLDQVDVVGDSYNPWDDWNHGHQLLSLSPDEGQIFDSIVFFANKGGEGFLSAAVEYSLNQVSENIWEAEETFRYETQNGISAFFGDVQRLTNGNTLVTYSVTGRIDEVSPDGTLLAMIRITGAQLGYAMWRPSLYGPPPY